MQMVDSRQAQSYFEQIGTWKNIPDSLKLKVNDKLSLESGAYSISKKHGQGGFGTVYQIKSKTNKQYALKILDLWRMRASDYQEMRQKFEEGYEIGTLASPYLVRNFHRGKINGNPYIIMEDCAGSNLKSKRDYFSRNNKFQTVANQVLLGLKTIHQNGIIHRDLKPENILFDHQENAKLADFDIAGRIKQTMQKSELSDFKTDSTGQTKNSKLKTKLQLLLGKYNIGGILGTDDELWGTLQYAPHEQLDHFLAYKFIGPSMDIYAFGVTMYELITNGKMPFGNLRDYNGNISKYKKAVREKKNYRRLNSVVAHIDNKWDQLIDECLNPNPNDRPQSIDEILSYLGLTKDENLALSLKQFGIPSLQIKTGGEINKMFNLSQIILKNKSKSITIGRYDEDQQFINDISISDDYSKYVSRNHATIKFDNNQWKIYDGQHIGDNKEWTNSTNGTYVNSTMLNIDLGIALKPGDIITMGETKIMFLYT